MRIHAHSNWTTDALGRGFGRFRHLLPAALLALLVLAPSALPAGAAKLLFAPGGTRINYWGDDPDLQRAVFAAERKHNALTGARTFDYLAISGGGTDGAYGAGYIAGWSPRPQFEVVTGISVGALIAPLAFAGTDYDQRILKVFQSLSAHKPAAPDELHVLVDDVIDKNLATDIARADRLGRLLLIGTRDKSTGRALVWDIGAIANSTMPDKLALIREIVLASASVPGIYSAVDIKVPQDGASAPTGPGYQQDGGGAQLVMHVPNDFGHPGAFKALGLGARRNLYVVYNSRLVAVPGQRTPEAVMQRGQQDLSLLYDVARRNGINFKLTAMPKGFPVPTQPGLWPGNDYLKKLYDAGYDAAQTGKWLTKP